MQHKKYPLVQPTLFICHTLKQTHVKKLLLYVFGLISTLSSAGIDLTYVKQNSFFEFYNDNLGFTVNGDTLFRTTDSGLSWNPIWINKGYFYKLMFGDENTCFVRHYNTATTKRLIFKSIDKGVTWLELPVTDAVDHSFYDAAHGAILKNDSILFSSDGGSTWTGIKHSISGPDSAVAGIEYMQDGTLFVTGSFGPYKIFKFAKRSIDGGQSWTTLNIPINGVGAPKFITGNTILYSEFITGKFSIKKTLDGGVTWSVDSFPGAGTSDYIFDIDSYQEKYVLATCRYDSIAFKVFCSSDAGENWTSQEFTENYIGRKRPYITGNGTAWLFGNAFGSATGVKMTNEISCLSQITATKSLEEISTLIYPNPSSNVLNVEVGIDPALILLFNANGSIVSEQRGVNTVELSVSHLKPGIYYLRIIPTSGLTSISKVMIE